MNTPSKQEQTKARWTLLAIAAVFTLPLALAWLFSVGPLQWRPAETVNYGILLQPPLDLNSHGVMNADGNPLTVDVAARDWFLVVLHTAACTDPCQDFIQTAERIRFAVGRDMDRVFVKTLGPEDEPPFMGGDSWLFPEQGNLIEVLRRNITGLSDTVLLIVDYQGYIVLAYPSVENGQDALNDLKRLLRATAR